MDAPCSLVRIEFPGMAILTEPIGSIPRSAALLQAIAASQARETNPNVGRFYLQMAGEPDRKRVLRLVSQLLEPHHTVFVGVIDPIHRAVETAAQVRDRVLEAASFLPIAQPGTTDDWGFAPFADDTSTARDIAFSKIRARVEGTELAARELGV
jgi:5-methyltetrahydropteroyltriglutamate--homocysteine methyltransferase